MGGRGQLFRNPVSPAFDRSPIAWVPFASDVSIAVAFFRLPFSPLVFFLLQTFLVFIPVLVVVLAPARGASACSLHFPLRTPSIEHGGLNRTS